MKKLSVDTELENVTGGASPKFPEGIVKPEWYKIIPEPEYKKIEVKEKDYYEVWAHVIG